MSVDQSANPSTTPFEAAGIAVSDFGWQYFTQECIRAKRYKEKYPTLPFVWVAAWRVARIGQKIIALDHARDPLDARAEQAVSLILQSRLSIERRYQLLAVVFDLLKSSQCPEITLGLETAADAYHKDAQPMEVFHYLQIQRRIEETLPVLRRLGDHVREHPASWYLVRDMVPPRPPSPAQHPASKIVYAAAMSLPYSTSGYATRTHGLARGYRTLGLDLSVVTRPPFPLRDKTWKDRADEVPLLDEIGGVAYHRLLAPESGPRNMMQFFEGASDVFEAKLRDIGPDYVIAGSDCINALPALIAARRLGLPFAYEVRGFWELTKVARKPLYKRSAEFTTLVALETLVATEADKVLTLTRPMAEELVTRGVDPQRLALMPNGVDPDLVRDDPKDMALADELGLPPNVPVIGYVGSIVEYEGLDDLAEACARVAARGYDFRLLIVGSENYSKGPPPITTAIRAAFQTAGISEKLIMPGRVPFDDVSRYYSLIDIAPIPRKPMEVTEKVSPIKPVEAMALGKLLVLSSVGGLTAFANGGATALVFEKGDIDDLARVLEMGLNDQGKSAQLRAAGREHVRQNRTWPAICRAAAAHLELSISPGDQDPR